MIVQSTLSTTSGFVFALCGAVIERCFVSGVFNEPLIRVRMKPAGVVSVLSGWFNYRVRRRNMKQA